MKGIIANKNLSKNQKLSLKDLTYARPAKYFAANQINRLIGRRLKKDIKKGHLIKNIF